MTNGCREVLRGVLLVGPGPGCADGKTAPQGTGTSGVPRSRMSQSRALRTSGCRKGEASGSHPTGNVVPVVEFLALEESLRWSMSELTPRRASTPASSSVVVRIATGDTAEAHTCGHRPSISDEMMSGGRSRATSCRLARLRTPSSWLAWAATQARARLRGGAPDPTAEMSWARIATSCHRQHLVVPAPARGVRRRRRATSGCFLGARPVFRETSGLYDVRRGPWRALPGWERRREGKERACVLRGRRCCAARCCCR
jgi:hypothetical protein